MKKSPLCLAIAASLASLAPATFAAEKGADEAVEVIQVRTVRQKLDQAGRLMDVIQKTEVLDEMMIENKHALSLTDAINNEPGVTVSNECSMCGVKRVMLNGMKGEHTTILVDGLPTHTLISGFYGVDAISTTGVDRIEVARGAGASLIAPEAIGGTLNIVTKEATENSATIDIAKGSHDFTAMKGSATAVSNDGKTGITLIGQYDKQDQEDHDDNGINEAPMQENLSLTAFVSHDINDSNNVQVRISKVESEVFGGPVIGDKVGSIGQAIAGFDDKESTQLFEGGDVSANYIGKPWEMTEWIKTSREEAYAKWLTEINSELSSEFAISYADHQQDSFYEGVDYVADDTMYYLRGKFDWLASDTHFLTFGIDSRHEEMRSKTTALDGNPLYVTDSFDYTTTGLFVQDVWTPTDNFEIAMALRVDNVEADFIDPSKPGVEIDKTFIAPRIDMRYTHSDTLTSRFSVGRGYRAPLSFFETDHGILDTDLGYQIEVDKLEESLSVNYALSYDNDVFSATLSLAHSEVDNLASLSGVTITQAQRDALIKAKYDDPGADAEVPVLSQLDETASVTTADIVAGYKLTDQLTISTSYEQYFHDDNYQESYAIAPIEQRASFDIEWQGDKVHAFWSTIWFGARDLAEYGYEGFNIKGDKNSLKPTNAPAFSTSEFRVKYIFSPLANVYAGVSNIFDYTQIGEGESPLFWDGAGDDAGIDVGYIFGPLHGREFYAGFEISL